MDKKTKCPRCGKESVVYTQLPYGDEWKCAEPGCDYRHYFSIGD